MKNKVSIIIPVVTRADLLQVCVDSILRYTSFPFELILVQEGENEEVSKVLKYYEGSLSLSKSLKFKTVQNKTPKGFAGAMNSGMAIAEGTHYCFLNSDTVAIPSWLNHIMEVFEKDKTIGLITPTFSEMDSKQVIDYNQGQEIDYVDDPISLKGVCFVISKEAMDKVGIWDERFGLGGGDDNDMCIRVKAAGYKLAIARRAYLYHYGSANFREVFKNDIEYSKKFSTAQFNILRKKHNMDKKNPRIYVAVMCFDGFVHSELALRLIEWTHIPDLTVKIKFYTNLAPLDNARNAAVKDFLEDYCDYLVFLDDDIIPPPGSLQELLRENKDVIAPLCFTMKADDNGLSCPMPVAHRYDKDKKYRPYYGKGVEETDIITGGMFMAKREIYEKLERPFYFTYHKNGLVIYSEDFVFSQQCQKLGYKLFTHYGLLCKHIRNVDIKGINDLMVKYGKQE